MRELLSEVRAILAEGPVNEEAVERMKLAVREAVPRLRESCLCREAISPGRYLCYKDPDFGFVVMLMCWGPGDTTAIHDHGCWGVEAVLKNKLRVTDYDESETNPQPLSSEIIGEGAVMHQLPPERDVHKVEHAAGNQAISIHIYGREMNGNRQFVPGEGFVPCSLATCEMKTDFRLDNLPSIAV